MTIKEIDLFNSITKIRVDYFDESIAYYRKQVYRFERMKENYISKRNEELKNLENAPR